jgi:hypothetical protein
VPVVATSTPEWIKGRISHYASFYGVSEITMLNIIACESGFKTSATNSTSKEYSVGLVQINLKAHNIEEEVARDVDFSLDFLAKNLKAGKGSMWTCWRNR